MSTVYTELVFERDEVTAFLAETSGRMSSFRAPIETIMKMAAQENVEQVRVGKGVAFGGAPWAPMAASTIRRGRDPGTLEVDSERMLKSLAPGGEGNVLLVSDFEGALDSDVPYKNFQRLGTRTIPARHFEEWYDEQLPTFDAVMQDYIAGHGAEAETP